MGRPREQGHCHRPPARCDWADFNRPAVILAIRQLKLGRQATAASILVSLHKSFRQAWLQFRAAADDKLRSTSGFRRYEQFVEFGCAVLSHDKLLKGHTGVILEDYLCHVLAIVQASDEGRRWMQELQHTEKTFKNTVAFLHSHKSRVSLEAVFPGTAHGICDDRRPCVLRSGEHW